MSKPQKPTLPAAFRSQLQSRLLQRESLKKKAKAKPKAKNEVETKDTAKPKKEVEVREGKTKTLKRPAAADVKTEERALKRPAAQESTDKISIPTWYKNSQTWAVKINNVQKLAIHSLLQGWGCLDRKGGAQESRRALAEGLGLSKISVL